MASRINSSVCMASHNGARYIHQQVDSILLQLGRADELVIVDDTSTDDTIAILDGFSDPRIRIMENTQNVGVAKTFERALREARGDIIFLCDQDDIWHPRKIPTIMQAFESNPGATLVLTNGEVIDANGGTTEKQLFENPPPLGLIANLLKNHYQGSAMAFRRELLDAALPFPKGLPMHDSWIGAVNAIVGRAVFLPDHLLFYRRHDQNVTTSVHGPMRRMMCQRWGLIKALLARAVTLIRVRHALESPGRPISGAPAKAGAPE